MGIEVAALIGIPAKRKMASLVKGNGGSTREHSLMAALLMAEVDPQRTH